MYVMYSHIESNLHPLLMLMCLRVSYVHFVEGFQPSACPITHTFFMAIMYLNTFMHNGPFMREAHPFLNIERTRTCLSNGNRTQTPYFWLQTN